MAWNICTFSFDEIVRRGAGFNQPLPRYLAMAVESVRAAAFEVRGRRSRLTVGTESTKGYLPGLRRTPRDKLTALGTTVVQAGQPVRKLPGTCLVSTGN